MIRDKRKRRHLTLRRRIAGTAGRPRLCVRRSNAHIYAQLVDDDQGRVLVGVSTLNRELREKELKPTAAAFETGKLLAEKARSLAIEQVVFDRAGYRYHGRVKAVAEGARKGGLRF